MEKGKTGAWKPNVIVMIIAVMVIAVVSMFVVNDPKDALPLATAAVGGFAGLGLALIRPDEKPDDKPDPDVTVPASTLRHVVDAPQAAYQRGYQDGHDRALKKRE